MTTSIQQTEAVMSAAKRRRQHEQTEDAQQEVSSTCIQRAVAREMTHIAARDEAVAAAKRRRQQALAELDDARQALDAAEKAKQLAVARAASGVVEDIAALPDWAACVATYTAIFPAVWGAYEPPSVAESAAWCANKALETMAATYLPHNAAKGEQLAARSALRIEDRVSFGKQLAGVAPRRLSGDSLIRPRYAMRPVVTAYARSQGFLTDAAASAAGMCLSIGPLVPPELLAEVLRFADPIFARVRSDTMVCRCALLGRLWVGKHGRLAKVRENNATV